jgi:septal ring factor EnvC (AmiA/AmiB activator)
MTEQTELERTNTAESAADSDQESRLKRYDQRIEEWISSLKDEAGQRSPEVLSALAAKARDVSEYLDKMAARARSKSDAPALGPPAEDVSGSDESTAAPPHDPGPSST